jgi:hypothetical protein
MLKGNNILITTSNIFSFISISLLIGICLMPALSSDDNFKNFDEVEEYNTKINGINIKLGEINEAFFIYGHIKNLDIINDGEFIVLNFIAKSVYIRCIYWSYFGPYVAIDDWICSDEIILKINYERFMPAFIGLVTKNFIFGMHPAYIFFNLCC